MRRGRDLREHRARLLKERAATVASRRKGAQEKIKKSRLVRDGDAQGRRREHIRKIRQERAQRLRENSKGINFKDTPAHRPGNIPDFQDYKNYQCKLEKPVKVAHVIESLGLGGAQTMMMELVNALNKYYGGYCENCIVNIRYKEPKYDKKLYHSYGVKPIHCQDRKFSTFCEANKIDVVVQHRTSLATCLKGTMHKRCKYVLINHTWHNMHRMRDFYWCDYYISVCKFLHKRTKWPDFVNDSRKLIILNGVENDYISDLETAKMDGTFRSGRCHRLVPSKFKVDSLQWMIGKMHKMIPGHHHYLLGHSAKAKPVCRKTNYLHYIGAVRDRAQKMSILKGLDVYFYETFQDEGASIAILESLACGVPVICKPLGGNPELIHNAVNGFIVQDRGDYLSRMRQMAADPKMVQRIKQRTLDDFNDRLHVKNTACKYMQLFENIIK